MLFAFLLLAALPSGRSASSTDSIDPADGVATGSIEFTRIDKGGMFASTSRAIVSGKWRMPGGGANGQSRVGCGDGRVGMSDPHSFSGLQGTIASELSWEELGPFTPREEMNDDQQKEAARKAVKTLQTASIPFRVTVEENNQSKAIDENLAMLGCLYLDAKNKRFVFDGAMASTRGSLVPGTQVQRKAWNQFGEAIAPRPPDRLEGVDSGVRFEGKYDPTSPTLTGTWRDANVDKDDALTHGQDGHEHRELRAKFHFVLREEKLELEVQPVGYEDWVPKAGADEKTAGNQLVVVARLVDAAGKPTGAKARSITFELSDVSQEPGVALNWPVGAKGTESDLSFEPASNPDLRVTGARNEQSTNAIDGVAVGKAVISAFDQGAWGTLKVRAELFDGTRLTGHLAGKKDQQEIPIPLREGDSKIARKWKKGHDFAKDDAWDEEELPKLDGKNGDGLSAYEEYRGLWADGHFVRLSPEVKELVIENQHDAPARPGLKLLKDETHLGVVELATDQLPKSRIVNANARTAHNGDQYGVRLKKDKGLARPEPDGSVVLGEARPKIAGLITSPKTCTEVAFDPSAFQLSPSSAVDVAHELAHALGVNHHGDRGYGRPVDFSGSASDKLYGLDGVQIPAFDQAGKVIRPGAIDGRWLLEPPIAAVGGQTSGDVGCIMAYTHLYAVVLHEPRDYYLVPKLENPTHFCTSGAGTGINDPKVTKLAGQPFSYFGNAGDNPPGKSATSPRLKRGNCLSQMHVRDSDAPPPSGRAP